MRRLASALFVLLALASPASAQLPQPGAEIPPYRGPFPGKAILVFTPADHDRLTRAFRGTAYHAAFCRAKPADVLSDGAVPGLVPVVLDPADADRLYEALDAGRPVGHLGWGRLRDVLHMTIQLGWTPSNCQETRP